jgi:hypothetical protein
MPVLLGGLVLLTARPAAACTCYDMSEAERVARYDAVFVGTPVSHVMQIDPRYEAAQREFTRTSNLAPLHRAIENNSSRSVWTFQVSRVYKGSVGQRQEIITPPGAPGGSNCSGVGGLRQPSTEPFVVFASSSTDSSYRLQPGQYASHLCSGSRPLADGGEPVRGELRAHAPGGPNRSWSPAKASPSSPSSPAATSGGLAATGTSRSDPPSPVPAGLAVGIGVLVAGTATGLGLVMLRARRRASPD